jgi:hypothetical protein
LYLPNPISLRFKLSLRARGLTSSTVSIRLTLNSSFEFQWRHIWFGLKIPDSIRHVSIISSPRFGLLSIVVLCNLYHRHLR